MAKKRTQRKTSTTGNGRRTGKRTGKRTAKRTAKRATKRGGKRSTKKAGKRASKKTGKRSGKKASKRSGRMAKRAGKRSSKKTGKRSSKRAGTRAGKRTRGPGRGAAEEQTGSTAVDERPGMQARATSPRRGKRRVRRTAEDIARDVLEAARRKRDEAGERAAMRTRGRVSRGSRPARAGAGLAPQRGFGHMSSGAKLAQETGEAAGWHETYLEGSVSSQGRANTARRDVRSARP